MSLLSTLSFVSQYAASGAAGVPPEVQQVAIQLSNQICELLTQLMNHILPWAGLSAALALLTGRLLLIRHVRVQNAILSGSRLSHEAGTRQAVQQLRRPKYAPESCIARTNRQALQLASTRIKTGQLRINYPPVRSDQNATGKHPYSVPLWRDNPRLSLLVDEFSIVPVCF